MFKRTIRHAGTLAAAALAAMALACASAGGGRSSGPTLPVQLEVRNNLGLPTDLSVYAITRGGTRVMLGDVPPATTKTFTFKPVSFSERYHLVAYRPLKRAIRSESFSVGDDMTGRIIWTLVPNIVGFEELDNDSTGTDSTGNR